jgi:hypothetical protein
VFFYVFSYDIMIKSLGGMRKETAQAAVEGAAYEESAEYGKTGRRTEGKK